MANFDEAVSILSDPTQWHSWAPLTPDDLRERALADLGFVIHTGTSVSDDDLETIFSAIRDYLTQHSAPHRVNSVFVDTTLLASVDVLLGEQLYLNPATLFDLSTFLNAVCFYDHIVHLENDHLDSIRLNEAIGGEPVIISLPVQSAGGPYDDEGVNAVGVALRSVWWETIGHVHELRSAHHEYRDERDTLLDAWRKLTGRHVTDGVFDHSKPSDWPSDGPALVQKFGRSWIGYEILEERQVRNDFSLDELERFISESIYRGTFNTMVAYLLKLEHLVSCNRLPHAAVMRRRLPVIRDGAIARFLDRAHHERAAALKLPQRKMHTPMLLSYALSRANRIEDLTSIIPELRHRCAPVRARKHELTAALSDGNLDEVRKLTDALAGQYESVTRGLAIPATIAAALAVVPALAGATTPIMIASLFGLGAGSVALSRDVLTRLLERVSRPDLRVLEDLSIAAGRLSSAVPHAMKLWGYEGDERLFAEFFDRIASVNMGG